MVLSEITDMSWILVKRLHSFMGKFGFLVFPVVGHENEALEALSYGPLVALTGPISVSRCNK